MLKRTEYRDDHTEIDFGLEFMHLCPNPSHAFHPPPSQIITPTSTHPGRVHLDVTHAWRRVNEDVHSPTGAKLLAHAAVNALPPRPPRSHALDSDPAWGRDTERRAAHPRQPSATEIARAADEATILGARRRTADSAAEGPAKAA